MGYVIILIISFVISTIIVNGAQQLYMKLIGAETMFFNGKKKLIAIVVIAMIIASLFGSLFGLSG